MASSVKRKEAFFLDFDTNQWLKKFEKKVEDFNGKGGAFERAVARMIPLIKAEFEAFMADHKLTGATADSLMTTPNLYWGDSTYYKSVGRNTAGKKGFTHHDVVVDKTKNILFVEYGFKLSEGGLPAVFLDIGRPGVKYKNGTVSRAQRPSYFVYYAIERNIRKFNEIFKEEVMKELGDIL